jgi:hypothetical protein
MALILADSQSGGSLGRGGWPFAAQSGVACRYYGR